jgi:uncharacterized DUF497 family protein
MRARFEWDPVKAAINLRKHHISFDLASRVFADPLSHSEQDRIENGERRWRTMGMVDGGGLLVVAHTVGEQDDDGQPIEVIRIISARKADRRERRHYEQHQTFD